ncbi:MAG: hypothetical protein AAF549_09020 [Pseudomonadota bacterium]
MINTNQIDAALGLLGIKRSELAQALGINPGTFNTYFTGGVEMKSGRNQQVREWLENAGVVFTEKGGVEPAQETIRVYRGQKGFQNFMMDVYETCRDIGGDVFVTNVDEALFDKWASDEFINDVYLKNMQSLPKGSFKFHTIVSEGDNYEATNTYSEYRTIPKEYWSPVSTYIYGNKMANIIFSKEDVLVRVFDQEDLVNAQRKTALFIWNHASAN